MQVTDCLFVNFLANGKIYVGLYHAGVLWLNKNLAAQLRLIFGTYFIVIISPHEGN